MLAILRAVMRHRLSRAGLVIIAVLCVVAIFAPVLAPYGPYDQDLYHVLVPPNAMHWLGTNNLGRDLFSRLLYGTRVSLFVGIVSSLVSAMLGMLIGLFAGFRGGVTDAIIMRITDAFLLSTADLHSGDVGRTRPRPAQCDAVVWTVWLDRFCPQYCWYVSCRSSRRRVPSACRRCAS